MAVLIIMQNIRRTAEGGPYKLISIISKIDFRVTANIRLDFTKKTGYNKTWTELLS